MSPPWPVRAAQAAGRAVGSPRPLWSFLELPRQQSCLLQAQPLLRHVPWPGQGRHSSYQSSACPSAFPASLFFPQVCMPGALWHAPLCFCFQESRPETPTNPGHHLRPSLYRRIPLKAWDEPNPKTRVPGGQTPVPFPAPPLYGAVPVRAETLAEIPFLGPLLESARTHLEVSFA